MKIVAEKVTAFVTRGTPQGTEILLFEHPYAGIQLPAGTVEVNEPHAAAAAREATEETGLIDLPPGHFLAASTQTLPDDTCLVAITTRVYARPDPTSLDWASIRNGILVQCNRSGPDFCQITYVEHDQHADPPYVNFQITGWVPTAVLTRQITRYFYHFPYHGRTPTTWWVDTDNHHFRLFWAPLTPLPPIVTSQRGWLNILVQSEGAGQLSYGQ